MLMGKLVVKDNAFLEAGHKLNEVEQQLVLLAIVKAREFCDSVEQLRGKKLSIHASDYMQTFNTTKDLAYKNLKKAVFGLYEAEWGYRYSNSRGSIVTHRERFTQNAIYIDSEAIVEFVFADAVIPMLVQLEKDFTSYEIKQVSDLSSRYAMRIYEMIMRHFDKKKGSGWLELSLDELKFRLGILPNEYPRMGNFKARVLDVAITQINERTDLNVTYEQQKQGRNITGFLFKSVRKSVKKDKPFTLTQAQINHFAPLLANQVADVQELAPAGMSMQDFEQWVKNDMTNPNRLEFYREHLPKVGFTEKI